jgi:branched-chain amino acid transport system permease protein
MITLAVASVFGVLASQLSDFTGGEDGRNFTLPEVLRPSWRLLEGELLGRAIDGRLVTYYLVFVAALAIFLVLLRVVNSPFGRVLLAIRENDFRAEALGYRTVVYRTLATCIAAVAATLAGVLMALWLRYVGPRSVLSFEVMTDILLIVVIGGMGRMYGAVVGTALFIVAQNYLQAGMGHLAGEAASLPWLARALHPDRWMLWMGVLFVACVYYFPGGIAGRLRGRET